jgi:hypothetical protein
MSGQSVASVGQAELDAALLLLARMGITAEDLLRGRFAGEEGAGVAGDVGWGVRPSPGSVASIWINASGPRLSRKSRLAPSHGVKSAASLAQTCRTGTRSGLTIRCPLASLVVATRRIYGTSPPRRAWPEPFAQAALPTLAKPGQVIAHLGAAVGSGQQLGNTGAQAPVGEAGDGQQGGAQGAGQGHDPRVAEP